MLLLLLCVPVVVIDLNCFTLLNELIEDKVFHHLWNQECKDPIGMRSNVR